MQRRSLLKLSLVSATALALAGGAVVLLRPGLHAGRLSAPSRELFGAVGRVILQGTLPSEPLRIDQALQGLVERIDVLIQGLPPHVQAELSQLLGLLCTAPGRLGLTGLTTDWAQTQPNALRAALHAMRFSSLALRQQTYHALHEIVGGAYFSDVSSWGAVGYPGPVAV